MDTDKINILIVDDEEQLLNSIRKGLEIRHFNVFTADRGDKALELARMQEIDIALVDLKMPGMKGEEVLKILKEEHKGIEVVILTGHGSIGSAVRCSKDGAYSYLQKPCSMDELLKTLVDAYTTRVLNKKQIEQKKMDELLKISLSHSPREILEKLKKIGRE